MNIRTIVIIAFTAVLIFYLLNKRWIRIRSVCFEGDHVSAVTIKKGIYSSVFFDLKVGQTKDGFSLLKQDKKIVLTLPSGKKKVFENITYYEKNGLNPAE